MCHWTLILFIEIRSSSTQCPLLQIKQNNPGPTLPQEVSKPSSKTLRQRVPLKKLNTSLGLIMNGCPLK